MASVLDDEERKAWHESGPSLEMQQDKIPYTVIKLQDGDVKPPLEFLKKFFFKDEPLNVSVGLVDETTPNCPELEEYCASVIPEGHSFVAVDKDGDIIGVCLNAVERREEQAAVSPESTVESCSNPKFKKILKLLTTVAKESDVFGKFPDIDKLLEVKILSVDSMWRGKGIAKALMEQTNTFELTFFQKWRDLSMEMSIIFSPLEYSRILEYSKGLKMMDKRRMSLAIENGIPLIRVDCSSAFSAKVVSRLGYKCVYTLQYKDHLDANGQPVFRPAAPHTKVETYVYQLTD